MLNLFKTLILISTLLLSATSCHKDRATRKLTTKDNEAWKLTKYTVQLEGGSESDFTDSISQFELTFKHHKTSGIFGNEGEFISGELKLLPGKFTSTYNTWNPAFHMLEMKQLGGNDKELYTLIRTYIGVDNKKKVKPLFLNISRHTFEDVEKTESYPYDKKGIGNIQYESKNYLRQFMITKLTNKELILDYGPSVTKSTEWDTSDVSIRTEKYYFELVKK
jgi:hypothetical protein